MPIVTLEKNTLTIDGHPIQDLKQEDITTLTGTESFNDTSIVSRCLTSIQSAYTLKEQNGYGTDPFSIDLLSAQYPGHSEAWDSFNNEADDIREEVNTIDVNYFASRIFNVEKPQEIEISDLAAEYITQNPQAEKVLTTNLRTGIINLTSVDQINEEILTDLQSVIRVINDKIDNLYHEINNYRSENDLYEEDDEYDYDDYDEYDDDYDYYDDYQNYYDYEDYEDEEYDYDEDLHFDDEENSDDNSSTFTEVFIFKPTQPLNDDDPWSDN